MNKEMQVRKEWPFGRFFDLFEPEFGRFFEGFAPHVPWTDGRMRIEEEMQDGMLVIRAELPGLDPEKDLEIDVTDDRLAIRAERRSEETETKEGVVRSEFRYGSLSRIVMLPRDTKNDDITATYKDGILEVRVPMPTEVKEAATRVAITRA
jgi:HSP20 family protein